MDNYLRIRAGKIALNLIRDEGLRPERIGTFIGPALGPRWIATAGVDLVLAETAFLKTSRRVLLAGASAGAWRMAAFAQKDPVSALRRFWDAYIGMNFSSRQSPRDRLSIVEGAIRKMLTEEETRYLLNNPHFDIGIDTVRVRGILGSDKVPLCTLGFLTAMGANFIHPALRKFFMAPVRFYAGKRRPRPARASTEFVVPLTRENIFQALLASGAVPLALKGVGGIAGAPAGVYFDGGLERYVFNEPEAVDSPELTLLIYHGGPLIPTWLDKKVFRPERRAPVQDRLVIVQPTADYIRQLPLGKVPDRSDWQTFEQEPSRRIRAWLQAVEQSRRLGERFLEIVWNNSIKRLVKPLNGSEQ